MKSLKQEYFDLVLHTDLEVIKLKELMKELKVLHLKKEGSDLEAEASLHSLCFIHINSIFYYH